MLRDKAFREPLSRIDLVTRLMSESQGGRRYVLGMEKLGGRRYMGIDWLERGVTEERREKGVNVDMNKRDLAH